MMMKRPPAAFPPLLAALAGAAMAVAVSACSSAATTDAFAPAAPGLPASTRKRSARRTLPSGTSTLLAKRRSACRPND